MAEDSWQRARLIPTSGINGVEEAERRATSALLAVMGSVREFGQAMVRGLGAPAGSLATFIEVPLKASRAHHLSRRPADGARDANLNLLG